MSDSGWARRAAAVEARAESAVGGLLRRRRGWRSTPLVFPSYGRSGDDGWVRLLGRVLTLPADRPTAAMLATNRTGANRTGANRTAANRTAADGRARGWRRYLTIAEPAHTVTVDVGRHRLETATAPGGYLDERLAVELPPGRHQVRVTTDDGTSGTGQVTVVDPAAVRRGVVSDIDDTVVITLLPRPVFAFWNTFVLREGARQPVPGMAAFLDAVDGGFVVYLSTGAWNYAPVIRDFLLRTGYPDGSLLMTDWGPNNQGPGHRWFRSGVEHKQSSLRRLHAEFPELTWTLVGDDGQHDPAIYDDFAAEHPGVVDTIAIRELTTGEHVVSHGSATAPDRERLARPRAAATGLRRISGPDGHALLTALGDIPRST